MNVDFDKLNRNIRIACDQGDYEKIEDLLTMRENARINPDEFLEAHPQYDRRKEELV